MKLRVKHLAKLSFIMVLLLTLNVQTNAKTITHNNSYKLNNKCCYLGINRGGVPQITSNWSSSNTSVATVTNKGDSDGGHKVIFKRKGKVTISCKAKKGNTYKWVLTIK